VEQIEHSFKREDYKVMQVDELSVAPITARNAYVTKFLDLVSNKTLGIQHEITYVMMTGIFARGKPIR
jgi:hypothetical protein